MNNTSITHNTITEFLTKLIQHSYGIFSVDQDGYIYSNNEPILFQDQQKPPESHKFLVYKENIKDPSAYILNPFSESLTLGVERTWFYDLLLSCTESALPVIKLMKILLHFGYCSSLELSDEEQQQEIQKLVDSKKKKSKKDQPKESPTSLYPFTDTQKLELSSFLSNISENITADVINQFDQIITEPNAFFKLIYQDTNKKAYVSSLIFNATERANYRSIKPKTWQLYQTLFKKIFEIEDIDDLSVLSSSISYPRFESIFTLFTIIQKHLSKFLYIILPDDQQQEIFIDNLQFFTEALKHLDIFKRLGGWLKCVPTAPVKPLNPVLTKVASPLSISPSYQYGYATKTMPSYPVYNTVMQGPNILSNSMVAPSVDLSKFLPQ
jgi:hypothetical protein